MLLGLVLSHRLSVSLKGSCVKSLDPWQVGKWWDF